MNQSYEVCGEAENGHEAVELTGRLKPDVVLLDYAMPIMNGLEAARLITESMPQCGLILFTMFASNQLSTLAQAAGVRTVISKDVGGVDAIIQAIEQISREGNLGNQTPIGARPT